jgi:hypothetical protein
MNNHTIKELAEKKERLLHNKFAEACKNGDLDTIRKIYNKYYYEPKKIYNRIKKKFHAFLKISEPLLIEPTLNPYSGECYHIVEAANQNHTDILKFFLTDKFFLKTIKKNNQFKIKLLSNILNGAMHNKNIDIVQLVLPLIDEKNEFFYERIFQGFEHACANDGLNVVEALFNDNLVKNQVTEIYETTYNTTSSQSLINSGFKIACKNGDLNLVKFFTDSSKLNYAINFLNYDGFVEVKNYSIAEYLICENNLTKEQSQSKIYLAYNVANKVEITAQISALIESRQLAQELNNELEIKNEPAKKRIKV